MKYNSGMSKGAGSDAFPSTLWSEILRAGDEQDSNFQASLEKLCAAYWRPVYVYLRRKGRSEEQAADLTQGFFAHLLEKNLLAKVKEGRGRFRGFLLAVLDYYLANEYRANRAEKRGGGRAPLSLEFQRGENEVRLDPVDPSTPEAAYQRSWALTVLRDALADLKREFESRGLRGHFDAVRDHLSASADRPGYHELSERLGCSMTDVTNLLHHSRKRLGALIRNRLRDTVDTDEAAEEELHFLFDSF